MTGRTSRHSVQPTPACGTRGTTNLVTGRRCRTSLGSVRPPMRSRLSSSEQVSLHLSFHLTWRCSWSAGRDDCMARSSRGPVEGWAGTPADHLLSVPASRRRTPHSAFAITGACSTAEDAPSTKTAPTGPRASDPRACAGRPWLGPGIFTRETACAMHSRPLLTALLSLILLFDPRREHSSVPTADRSPRRAQTVSRRARRAPRRAWP
jgi:hypothetical protein